MRAVALGGLVGRYLYGNIPRRQSGEELSLRQINLNRAETIRRLEFEFGLKADDIQRLIAFSTPREVEKWGVFNLFRIFWNDISRWLQSRRLARYFQHKYGLPPKELSYLARAIARQRAVAQRIAFLEVVQKIFHWWHVIHKPFAYAIFLVLTLHIILTMSLGSTWIF